MCIIVAKPKNVPMPSRDTLETCFRANPDGAGFMYPHDGEVVIEKGFMDFEEFMDGLDAAIPDKTGTAVVMHFRITTHGGTNPECCHPFPLTDDKVELKALMSIAPIGVAHNGIIHGRSTAAGWSDTMDFIAGVMTPLYRMKPSFMRNADALDLLESACDSKLAIMDGDGDIATVGKFYEDHGVMYSNTSYISIWDRWSYSGSLWNDATWGDLDEMTSAELIASLPFPEVCVNCPHNDDCIDSWPECTDEYMAEQAVDYYVNEEEEVYGAIR